MKKVVLLCGLLLVTLAASANPVIARMIARVWFDAADNFYLMVGEESVYYPSLATMTVSTMAGMYAFPANYTPPPTDVYVVNLSQVIPGLTVQRDSDYFSLSWDGYSETVHWGPEVNLINDLHALTSGQSAVQVRVYIYPGWAYNSWAKDNSTTGTSAYEPALNCSLSVHVQDPMGNPAANIPVYMSPLASIDTNFTPYYTDTNGDWTGVSEAVRTRLMIYDPATSNPVADEILFPEPGQTCQINTVVSAVAADDPVQVPSGVMQLYPSVLNRSSGSTLHLKYEGSQSLHQPGELALYDLRGRMLANALLPVSGEVEWVLPPLSNGIYFVALRDSGMQLARQRLTVIK